MKNLVFVIWMLGFPLVLSIDAYVDLYLLQSTYTLTVSGIASAIRICIWFYIGYILFEKDAE
jgi:hypothetical protein